MQQYSYKTLNNLLFLQKRGINAMNLKEIIFQLKKKEGFSNEDIALKIGVNKSTISRWLKGEVTTLQEESAKRLSSLLGYDIYAFLNNQKVTFKKPILGIVKAGYNLFADQNYLGEEEVDYNDYQRGDYFLKVSGNSMIGDGIMDGSYVYVQKTNSLKSGEIGVVMIDEEVTVKRVIWQNEILILEASNSSIKNRYFNQQEIEEIPIRILGKVLYCKTNFVY